jgi:hypothetical protein
MMAKLFGHCGHETSAFALKMSNPASPSHHRNVPIALSNVYEGCLLSLTGDKSFIDLPPGANHKMPDLEVGSGNLKLLGQAFSGQRTGKFLLAMLRM